MRVRIRDFRHYNRGLFGWGFLTLALSLAFFWSIGALVGQTTLDLRSQVRGAAGVVHRFIGSAPATAGLAIYELGSGLSVLGPVAGTNPPVYTVSAQGLGNLRVQTDTFAGTAAGILSFTTSAPVVGGDLLTVARNGAAQIEKIGGARGDYTKVVNASGTITVSFPAGRPLTADALDGPEDLLLKYLK